MSDSTPSDSKPSDSKPSDSKRPKLAPSKSIPTGPSSPYAKWSAARPTAEETSDSKQPHSQANNPLHGLTLESIVNSLVNHFGWEGLSRQIDIKCFTNDPSVKSSLKFLRKTPWAREKVENLFLSIQK